MTSSEHLTNVDLSSEFYTDDEANNPSGSLLGGGGSASSLPPQAAPQITSGGAMLSDAEQPSRTARLCGFLSVEYYRPMFDVDTSTVTSRIKSSMTPWNTDVFASTPESPPDMYGPFWVATSLVFFIAGESNLNAYLAQASGKFERDFTLLSLAASMIYVYTFLVSTGMWAAAKYSGGLNTLSLLQVVSMYGYSLSVFILASFLCVIPASWLQWIVVLGAIGMSGAVLGRNLRNALLLASDSAEGGANNKRTVSAVLIVAMALHFVFGLMLKLYFFQGADLAPASGGNSATSAPQLL
jgi:hypothetical protein